MIYLPRQRLDILNKMTPDEIALDALKRCRRILGDTVRLELSAAAWDTGGDPYLADFGPVWSGLPGEHPLLPLVRDAIKALESRQGEEE